MNAGLEQLAQEANLKQTIFFDLDFSAETQSAKSKTNPEEAQFIQNLLLVLANCCSSKNLS